MIKYRWLHPRLAHVRLWEDSPTFGALAGGPAARDADTGQLCTPPWPGPPAGLLRKDGLKVRAVLLSLYLSVPLSQGTQTGGSNVESPKSCPCACHARRTFHLASGANKQAFQEEEVG